MTQFQGTLPEPFRTFRIPVSLLTAAVLLAGCLYRSAPVEVEQPDRVLGRIAELREALVRRDRTDRLEAVQVPLAESWLEQPLSARYRALPANRALRLVVQGRPVRFNFSEAGAPPVVFPPGAATIREHLDSIAAQADWSYALEHGVVQVRDIETRQFILHAQPGSTDSEINLRGLKDAGGAAKDNAMKLTLDPYTDEILAAVSNILGDGESGQPDGRVAISPSANMLIVTARPNAMRQVDKLIDAYNRSVSQIVQLEMSLIEVTFGNAENRDLLLDLIRRSNDLPLGLVIGGSGGGGAAIGIGEGGFPLDDLSRSEGQYRYDGSSAVFEWLGTFGDTTVNYDDTIEVINNHVASMDVTRTEQYVSSITLEAVGEGDAVVPEVEFSELRTGTVVHVQPTIVGDRITLRLGLSRSVPLERTPFSFGGVSGTGFTTSDFNRLLSVSLTDGEPKLLASLSSASSLDRNSGIPLFSALGIGTGRQTEASRRETVMLITATILKS